jgi:putative transposase
MRCIDAEQACYPITMRCRLVDVSRAGYYAWSPRRPSARAQADAVLTEEIRAIHVKSRQSYGGPRMHATLQENGGRVSRKRIARLMRAAGLRGGQAHRRPRTTVSDPTATPAPNLVQRRFDGGALNRIWVTDITYLATDEGWVYRAALLDAHSRRVVGWALADHLRTELALEALDMALRERRPRGGELVHHSDRGGQYTAAA